MNQLNAINQNVTEQLLKIHGLLSDAVSKNDCGAVLLSNKAQTIITTLELLLCGTGLLDNKTRTKLDDMYKQAHEIMNGVYKAC